MRSDRRAAVAIIGGGASGTILAAQFARSGIDSVMIDGSGRAGHGVAYSTTEPAHLLNVRAEGMSAWAQDPGHFAARFEQEGGHPRGFAERRLFGRYLREILDEAIASGRVEVEHSTAVRAGRDNNRWTVELDDGRTVQSDALVLAIGNQEPDTLRGFENVGRRFINNPWAGDARAAVLDLADTQDSVLLIGTGLTMVDLALSLDSAGHRGHVVALSRRGQIPRSHAEFEPAPVDRDDLPTGLLPMWRWLRERSAAHGWRAAVDSLRPHSHALWQGLDDAQQRRFLRHARPWWDVHRHRIAPDVAATIARMVGEGRLEIIAGRVGAVRPLEDAIEVEVRKRGSASSSPMRFAYAINCTGPLHSITRTRDPLLRSLLGAGEVRSDRLGIGIEVDERSRAAGTGRLWALGPLTKGRYWEIIAVPDIREQAAAVAQDVARELSHEPSV